MITECLLCGIALKPISQWRQRHPVVDYCLVRLTDQYGVFVDEKPKIRIVQTEPEPFDMEFTVFPPIEDVLERFFKAHGLHRLGGKSTGHGWSYHRTFQLCDYLFYRRYREPVRGPALRSDPVARAVGTLIHVFLAIYYQRMIVPDYPVTPEMCRDSIILEGNPDLINEGWRCFIGYALYYQHENIQPLAIEYDLRDPRTGESCRYDLVAFYPEPVEDRPPGTYVIEHKSSGRFDDATLDGWRNDGEVLGQIMLWERLGLHRKFGPLRGVIMNIIGKQPKNQKFHRTIVHPNTFKIAQHAKDLRANEARVAIADSSGYWPRKRANCITQYGKCDLYEHCAGEE